MDKPTETKTLRDEFAMAALKGLVMRIPDKGSPMLTTENKARAAYEYADAMMAERKK